MVKRWKGIREFQPFLLFYLSTLSLLHLPPSTFYPSTLQPPHPSTFQPHMNQPPPLVLGLVAINAVIFLIGLLFPGLGKWLFDFFALYFPKNDAFQFWQLVSYMFLHGGIGHILFNMFALASFGSPLAIMWGTRRFLTFYFATGIGAAFVYTAVNYYQFSGIYQQLIQAGFSQENIETILTSFKVESGLLGKVSKDTLEELLSLFHTPAIGASGAIYGVLVAFGVLFPNAKLSLIFFPVPVAAKYFIPILVAADLFSGITGFSIFGSGIAHWAHVGGAIIGFLIMLCWKKRAK